MPRPFLCFFALDAAQAEAEGAVWVQIAAGGDYKGHPEGPFTLDQALFEELVRNFRAHPSYVAGGGADVIPWDFHHESEHSGPSVAVQGAPAQGWVRELDVRQGEDGVAQLWALTRWLDLARTYVREGKYRWASVAIWPKTKHPVTGENIGWWLSSVALTNDPFIQGMAPLVASRRALEEQRRLLVAKPEWALSELRYTFGLSEADGVDTIGAELAKVRTYVTTGQAPAGVDVAGLIHRLRCMLSLPLLTEDLDVLDQADLLIAKLSAAPPAPIATKRTKDDDMNKLLELVKKARLRAVSTEDEAADVILAELGEGGDAKKTLEALMDALGVEDKEGALKSIVDLMAKAKKLEEAMPQIAQLRTDTVKAETEDEEKDVEQALAAHRLPAGAKPALLAMRRGSVDLRADLDDAAWSKALDAKRQAKADFVKAYPLPAAEHRHLTQSLTATPHSPVLRSLTASHTGPQFGAPPLPDPPLGAGGPTSLRDLEGYGGRNVTEKALSYVRAQPGGKELSFEDAHVQASILLRRLRAA